MVAGAVALMVAGLGLGWLVSAKGRAKPTQPEVLPGSRRDVAARRPSSAT